MMSSRREIDRGVEPRPQVEVMQELRLVLQLEQAKPLAPYAKRPVRQPAVVHLGGRLSPKCIDDRNVANDLVRLGEVAEFEHVRQHGVQSVIEMNTSGKLNGGRSV
jgi:hypothetical protein